MLLRLIRGNVAAGREADFVAMCRQQAIDRARAQGLVSFFTGYQPAAGHDKFVMAAVWDSEADAVQAGGDAHQPAIVAIFDGVATVESFDVYDIIEPAFRGVVDAPGGVVRVTTARVSSGGLKELLHWLVAQPRGRASTTQRLLLGWALAQRQLGDSEEIEVVAVTAWPSPLVIEAVAEPGRTGATLYADIDRFTDDVRVEQYRAVALELPDALSDVGSRRVIAARFDSGAAADAGQSRAAAWELLAALPVVASRRVIAARSDSGAAADAAAAGLHAALGSPQEANISVAPLGAPGAPADALSFIVVARVSISEYARAERLIAQLSGEVILSQPDTTEKVATKSSDESFPALSPAPGLSPA